MVSKYQHKNIAWIDLKSPTREEVESLMKEYAISPIIGNELLATSARSKADFVGNLIYLILHFPKLTFRGKEKTEQEIDFVIGHDFVITAHYELVDSLHQFSKVFETSSILDKSHLGDHAGFLFFLMIKELYKHAMLELDEVYESMKKIEKKIFEGKEKEMVRAISGINKQLLDFSQAIRFHGEVLKSFESAGKTLFGEAFTHYLSAITGEYYKVQNALQSHKEVLNELRETNDSLLTQKTNETMKVLTIIALMTLPLGLIADIFGMNTYLPIVGIKYDFWIVIAIMIAAVLAMAIYFKGKKWL